MAVTGSNSVTGMRERMRSWRCGGRASHGQAPESAAVGEEAMSTKRNGDWYLVDRGSSPAAELREKKKIKCICDL